MCPVPPGTLPLDPVRRPLDSMGRLMPLRLGPSGKQNPAVFLDQTTCPVPGLVQSPAVKVTITSLCFSTLDLGLAGMCPVPPISARGRFRTPLASVAKGESPRGGTTFGTPSYINARSPVPPGPLFRSPVPPGPLFTVPPGPLVPPFPAGGSVSAPPVLGAGAPMPRRRLPGIFSPS
jgi:hypothetical protein